MTPDSASVFLEGLRTELKLYSQILDLARRQRDEAEAGRTEELLAVLAEKGRLADEVNRVSQTSREMKADWGNVSARMRSEEAEAAKSLLNDIADTLRKIVAEEDACQKILGHSRSEKIEELIRMQKGRRAAQAYGQRPATGSRFKDEKK